MAGQSACAVLLLLSIVACQRNPAATNAAASAEAAQTAVTGSASTTGARSTAGANSSATAKTDRFPPVRIAFQNVHLHVMEGVVLEVRRIEGALISVDATKPPVFDDQHSFTLRIDAGEVAMTASSLTRLLNDHVFAFEKSPISDVEVSIENGRLKQSGKLHKGVSVPFSIVADVSATADGRVRLHPVEVKTAGIPSKGLLKVFGVELDDLVKSNRAHGFEIIDDDFLLSTTRLIPAPQLQGHLKTVRIEGGRIVQTFGTGAPPPRPAGRARNYMQYRGGSLRFGKLTMSDADMWLLDADPGDPFDFYPAQYLRQLVAGYSKNTPEGGLRVYMPDYNEAARADLRPADR